MSIFDVIRLRNFDTFRAFLYVLVPVLIAAFAIDHGNLLVALAAAVLSPALMAVNTEDGFRTWFYTALIPLQGLLVGLGVVTDQQVTPWLAVIAAVIGGGVAASNVKQR